MRVSTLVSRSRRFIMSGAVIFISAISVMTPAAISQAQDAALLFDGIDDVATIPSTND